MATSIRSHIKDKLKGKHILLADDEVLTTAEYENALIEAGCKLTRVKSIEEAYQSINKNKNNIDFIILDLDLHTVPTELKNYILEMGDNCTTNKAQVLGLYLCESKIDISYCYYSVVANSYWRNKFEKDVNVYDKFDLAPIDLVEKIYETYVDQDKK
ncbi:MULTISPECIES: hypothetical protein [unclassified Maridesulfovibrio]|uniref:hypothetical protein n=1 Tax=unclassified Maridesulfovibrio TaxID=2794999 RepID=UPI003B3E3859